MPSLQTLWQDARRGARGLLQPPGFTIAAVLTLALGIGANAAIFSVVNAVLLSPLPYQQPDRRVMIWSRWDAFDKTWVSPAEVLDYRERCRTLASVAAWGTGQVNLTGDGDPIRVGAARVTANTLDTLGAALTTVVFSLVPAWRAVRIDLTDSLKEGLVASYVPAWRAASVDPWRALRTE